MPLTRPVMLLPGTQGLAQIMVRPSAPTTLRTADLVRPPPRMVQQTRVLELVIPTEGLGALTLAHPPTPVPVDSILAHRPTRDSAVGTRVPDLPVLTSTLLPFPNARLPFLPAGLQVRQR